MEEKSGTFTYSYSARQQEEVKKIRQKYLPREEDRMEQLRKMDQSVTKPGMIIAVTLGVISTLIMGTGMCCVMKWNLFLPGILIGIVGIAGMAAAYPLYQSVTKRQREKLAPQILKLTEELMK